LITILAAFQIPKIHVDSSTEIFIPQDHEISKIDREIEEEFGAMDSIIMGVKVNFGTVLEPEVLSIIDLITKALENSDNIKSVMSITNMDYLNGTTEGMEVIPILEDMSPGSIKEFKKRLVDWNDVYEGTFISADSNLCAIIVQPISGYNELTNKAVYEQIKELAAEYESSNLSFPIAGLPVVTEEISRSIMSDLYWLIPAAAGLILGILFLSFRKLEGVLFPLLGLAVGVVWVMGIIGFLNITFTMATLLVPVLLLVVGSAYGIHVMSHFYEGISQKTGFLDYENVSSVIGKSLKTTVTPVILAGLTTAGGFLSLVSSPLGPFRIFGILSAVGVICSQLASLVLIPSLLRLRYSKGIDTEKYHKIKDKEERNKASVIFIILEKIVRRRKWIVLLISIALITETIVLIPKITVGTDTVKFFTPNSSVVKDITIFNENLSGTNFLSVMISAPEPGDILDPKFLSYLEKFENYIEKENANVKKVQTVVASIKRINKLMNQDTIPYFIPNLEDESVSLDFFSADGSFGNDSWSLEEGESDSLAEKDSPEAKEGLLSYSELSEMLLESHLSSGNNISIEEFISSFLSLENFQGESFNEIPLVPEKYGFTTQEELKNLITQYLVLYSGNLDMIINDSLEPDKTLITIQLADISQKNQKILMNNIDSFWNNYLPLGWSYEIGGGATMQYVLSNLVTRSQIISLISALLVVWIIVSAMFRSPLAGLIGLVPVFFALAGIFLFMILFQFNLDIITSLLASLAIGIGVDYSIHIMNAYKRNIAKGNADCLNKVYRTTGKAVFINAVSVAVGFLSLTISEFVPIRQMGVLFAVSMIFACLASLIVLPIILNKLKPRFLGVTL
jgi:predicted RND superfamily exporter protein